MDQSFLDKQTLEEQLFFHPDRHSSQKRLNTLRSKPQIGLQEAFKFHQWFVIKHDVADVAEAYPAGLEAVIYGLVRKPGIMLFPGKALFLCRGYNLSVPH